MKICLMRRESFFLIGLLFSIGITFGCEDRTILHPGFPDVEDDTILLDFSYRVSTNYYGYAQFQIMSQNIVSYEWSFGFLNKEGKLVTSTSSSPGIFFPANGQYKVTLKGLDRTFKSLVVSQTVTITNFP